MEQQPTKVCRKCGGTFTYDLLKKNRTASNGVDALCLECHRKAGHIYLQSHREQNRLRAREYREKHPEEQKLRRHEYYQKHATEIKEYQHTYRENNAEKISEYKRRWSQLNAEKIRQKRRLYYQLNRSKIRQSRRAYYYSKPEIQREKTRVWKKQNSRRVNANNRNRRALKKNANGTHTAEDITILMKQSKGKCYWCGKKIKGTPHIDHRIALDRGGSNDASNLVVSCVHCNTSKKAKMPWEFNGRLL
jgi:hypothetical protein